MLSTQELHVWPHCSTHALIRSRQSCHAWSARGRMVTCRAGALVALAEEPRRGFSELEGRGAGRSRGVHTGSRLLSRQRCLRSHCEYGCLRRERQAFWRVRSRQVPSRSRKPLIIVVWNGTKADGRVRVTVEQLQHTSRRLELKSGAQCRCLEKAIR
jgi:hypothetical protein